MIHICKSYVFNSEQLSLMESGTPLVAAAKCQASEGGKSATPV